MDPSMLIGFLITDERDWEDWKGRVREAKAKAIVRVCEKSPPGDGEGREREEAVDEVEAFDDTEDEEEEGGDTATEVGGGVGV